MTGTLTLMQALIALCVVSCAPLDRIKTLQSRSTHALTRISEFASSSVDSIRPNRVKVVAVREKDLKKLPTGKERALAYQAERKQGLWIFNGMNPFKEPALPETGAEMNLGLLPPTAP